MKKTLSAALSGLMLISTVGCTKQNKSKSDQKPAESSEVDETLAQDQSVITPQNTESSNANSNQSVDSNSFVNSTVEALMKSGKLFIKDSDGKDISMDEYKLNPNQYFIITKIKDSNSDYQVLNTIASKQEGKKIKLSYKIYKITGDIANFKSANLGEAKFTETLELDMSLTGMLANKAAIKNFMERINGSEELTQNRSILENISNFMFPTAYASYTGKLTTMAIIFTSSAGVFYLFHRYSLGNISLAVGITFWMLLIIQY